MFVVCSELVLVDRAVLHHAFVDVSCLCVFNVWSHDWGLWHYLWVDLDNTRASKKIYWALLNHLILHWTSHRDLANLYLSSITWDKNQKKQRQKSIEIRIILRAETWSVIVQTLWCGKHHMGIKSSSWGQKRKVWLCGQYDMVNTTRWLKVHLFCHDKL